MKLYLTFYDRQSTLTKSPAKPTKAIDAVLTVPMAFAGSARGLWPSALPVIKLRYNFILSKYDTSNPNCRQILRFDFAF